MAAIRKRGKFYHWRGTIPARQADGSIARIRHEESLRTESKVRAREIAADLERHYHDLAYGKIVKRGVTFAQAAETYILTRGKSDRFISKLIEHFGEIPLNEIDQQKATEAASKLYPGWKGSSLNRAIYTPLSAIGVEGLTRPKEVRGSINIPSDEWFNSVLGVAPPKLAALIAFLTLTGRRVGEAIALTEKDVDERGVVEIARTKTGVPVRVAVPELCLALLADSAGYYARKGTGQPSQRLFGYSSLQSASVALRRTCERAGVPYYSFHKCGRHSFATRGLKAGKSIKWLQIAGGWKSHKSLDRYLHLEQSEVARDVDEMGREWSKARKLGNK